MKFLYNYFSNTKSEIIAKSFDQAVLLSVLLSFVACTINRMTNPRIPRMHKATIIFIFIFLQYNILSSFSEL